MHWFRWEPYRARAELTAGEPDGVGPIGQARVLRGPDLELRQRAALRSQQSCADNLWLQSTAYSLTFMISRISDTSSILRQMNARTAVFIGLYAASACAITTMFDTLNTAEAAIVVSKPAPNNLRILLSTSSQQLQLTGASRWVIYASRQDRDEAI